MQPGEVIDNRTLSQLFAVANSGGMRRSLVRNHLVVVADWTKCGVHNRWNGDVLHYVGQGQGDQALVKQNLTLARSPVTGEAIHLFEVRDSRRYVYRGRVELAGAPYQEQQRDATNQMRTVWMFPLRIRPLDATTSETATPAAKEGPPSGPYSPAGAYAVVRDDIDADKLIEVNAKLDELKALGVDVVDQRDVEDARYLHAQGRWHDEVMANMRRSAKQIVRDLRDRYRREGRQWAFADEEVEIDNDAREDRLRQVLDMIGHGDQFEQLRNEALAGTPRPNPPAGSDQEQTALSEDEMKEMRAAAAKLHRR